MPASKSSAWRNSSCRRGFCAPLLGWPLRPQTFPQGEPPPADHLCKRELTTNKWLWVQEILGPCQGGLAGGHSHTQRPPVKGSSRGTRWMLMRFSGLGFLLTRNEGKKPRRWGAVISGVRKTLSNVWIKGAGRWKQRSHEGDCCYGVLTPKNNFIQLVVFLRLCLATHDRAGRTKTGLYRGLYFIVMKYWLRQEGKDWGEGSRLSSTSRGHRTFVQRLRSSLPVCEQAHHSRIAGDCPQAYGLGAGDGHPLGMPPPHHVWAPRHWLPELATSEEEALERARTSHRALLGGQGQSQAKLLLFHLGLFRELNRAPMPLAPGNWEMKTPNTVTPSPPGPLNPQAAPGTSSAQLYLSPPQSAGRMKQAWGPLQSQLNRHFLEEAWPWTMF